MQSAHKPGEQTSVLEVRAGESTTELDRSAFMDAASTALPFAPTSEPRRAVVQSAGDGALPFRPSAQTPPATPRPSAPPNLKPRVPPPPLAVLARSSEAFVEPPPSTLGQLQSLSRPAMAADERSVPEPPLVVERPAPIEDKDKFRKAFGRSAQPQAASTPSLPSTSASDAAMALGGLKATLQAARAASDAAADARGSTASAASQERSPGGRRSIVDLVAFDPGVPKRLRRSKAHAPLLIEPSAARAPRKVDDPVGEQTAEERARIDVLRVLSCGTPLGAEELHAAFDTLLDDPNDFEIPLFLVEGDLKPTMDEVETLRVAVELAKPHAGNSKRVQAALAAASEALARTAPPVADTATALYKQLEASTSELSLPSRHLADLVDRTLLEARSFKKRTLLGAPRIRADLTIGRTSLPIYLPDVAASQLPLLPGFPLAALVELRPREDASESNPSALVAFALGRVLRARK